jgi:hypothetical protein
MLVSVLIASDGILTPELALPSLANGTLHFLTTLSRSSSPDSNHPLSAGASAPPNFSSFAVPKRAQMLNIIILLLRKEPEHT